MEILVFLPGIYGSRLLAPDGDEIWPPTVSEFIRDRYGRVDQLVRDDLEVGGLLDRVSCCDIYGSLIRDFNDIGFEENDSERRLHIFPYDWRRDLQQITQQLAQTFDELHDQGGVSRYFLVAHSMGGLISRHLLESGLFDDRPWFPLIQKFVALAVPHDGAPLALFRVAGLDGSMGLSGQDLKRLTSDPRYPSGYQLLPPPRSSYVRDISAGQIDSKPVDVFSDEFIEKHELSAENMQANRQLRAQLNLLNRPDTTTYIFFSSAALKTLTSFELDNGNLIPLFQRDGGDETVPTFSSSSAFAPTISVNGEHVKIFKSLRLRRKLFELLGAPAGVRPASASGVPSGDQIVQDIVVQRDPVSPRGTFSVILNFRDPTSQFDDSILLTPRRVVGSPDASGGGADHSIQYSGAPMRSLSIELTAPTQSGFYDLSLRASTTDDVDPPVLTVRL